MADVRTNIQSLLVTRAKHAKMVAEILGANTELSEVAFCSKLLEHFKNEPETHSTGWYDPPPGGVAALFAQPPEYKRLHYGSLRKEESWPRANNILGAESIGFIYGSPVNKSTGVHADISLTVYRGNDQRIQQHLVNALTWHERVAEFAQVGMSFAELFAYAKSIMSANNRINGAWLRQRPITTTTSADEEVIGDTVPWTNKAPVEVELRIINQGNVNEIKELIRQKRLYISSTESYKIPESIVITIETNLEDAEYPELPLALFYIMVIFENGQKKIISNYEPIFQATGMDKFITSKY